MFKNLSTWFMDDPKSGDKLNTIFVWLEPGYFADSNILLPFATKAYQIYGMIGHPPINISHIAGTSDDPYLCNNFESILKIPNLSS